MFDNRQIYCPIRLGHAQYNSRPPPHIDLQAVNVRGMPREGESTSVFGGHLGRLWALTAPSKLHTGSCMSSCNLRPEAIRLSYWPNGIAINTASA